MSIISLLANLRKKSIDFKQYNKDKTSFLKVSCLRSALVKVHETQAMSNSLPWLSFWNTLRAPATSEASVWTKNGFVGSGKFKEVCVWIASIIDSKAFW
jgi:hypothetical protein